MCSTTKISMCLQGRKTQPKHKTAPLPAAPKQAKQAPKPRAWRATEVEKVLAFRQRPSEEDGEPDIEEVYVKMLGELCMVPMIVDHGAVEQDPMTKAAPKQAKQAPKPRAWRATEVEEVLAFRQRPSVRMERPDMLRRCMSRCWVSLHPRDPMDV